MTAFSISVLRFDSKSDERIQRACGRIQQLLGGDASVTYAPHVSLIPTDVQDQAELTRRIRNLVSAQPAFDITFSHLGLFTGSVLFLGVTATDSLLAFHQRCFELSSPGSQTPWIDLYQPGSWVPHCTLAMGVRDELMGSLLAEANSCLVLPIVAKCESVDLLVIDDGSIRVLETIRFPVS